MRYEAIPVFEEGDVEKFLGQDDLDKLRLVALSLALNSGNPEQAEGICLRLANHKDSNVRGNAILGLGHIARIHGTLMEDSARPLVEAALKDTDEWVRGQAEAAADDIEHFLKWKLKRL
jgi:hypothetical protein